MKLVSSGQLTSIISSLGIETWDDLTSFIAQLPYGRNANRTDFSLVLKEQKGTCSSKHAFLKQVAIENNFQNIELIIGIFKMSKENMPKIGTVLEENNLDYIPEAHCYLKVNEIVTDFTSEDSLHDKIKNDILEELRIEPFQVCEFKVNYHKEFLKRWLTERSNDLKFDQIWEIREKCIQNLSNQ